MVSSTFICATLLSLGTTVLGGAAHAGFEVARAPLPGYKVVPLTSTFKRADGTGDIKLSGTLSSIRSQEDALVS
jgi:hypothetical protein